MREGSTVRPLIRAIVVAIFLVLGSVLPAVAQTTFDLQGHFREGFGRAASSDLCDLEAPFCGDGMVSGLGKASTLAYEDGTKTITLAGGVSTLVMHEDLVLFETPGASQEAPGAQKSFGNPYMLVVSWVADPDLSTGIFAGATGTGTTSVVSGGDVIIITTEGTLILQ